MGHGDGLDHRRRGRRAGPLPARPWHQAHHQRRLGDALLHPVEVLRAEALRARQGRQEEGELDALRYVLTTGTIVSSVRLDTRTISRVVQGLLLLSLIPLPRTGVRPDASNSLLHTGSTEYSRVYTYS